MPVAEESLRLSTDGPVCRQSRPPLTCTRQILPAPKTKSHSAPCQSRVCFKTSYSSTVQSPPSVLLLNLISSPQLISVSKDEMQWTVKQASLNWPLKHKRPVVTLRSALFFHSAWGCFGTRCVRPQAKVRKCYSSGERAACAGWCRDGSCELAAWVLHPPQLFLSV